jgi:hypothetical protein
MREPTKILQRTPKMERLPSLCKLTPRECWRSRDNVEYWFHAANGK